MKKRLCALLLFCAFLIISCSSAASAEAGIDFEYPAEHLSSQSTLQSLESAVDLDALESYLFEQFKTCPDYIDISSFGLDYDYSGALKNFIWDEMYGAFQIYALGTAPSLDGSIISEVYATYRYDAETYNSMYAECVAQAEKLLSGIKGNSKLAEVEKALLIHDRLAIHCEYDYDAYLAGALPEEAFYIYGALVSRQAVCQGYAEAYGFLLDMVGIESYICESDTLNHAWNIVYIGGKPYHVDVTWDDPVWDVNGRVDHENFLRSNSGIAASGHNASDYDMPAIYGDYENASWMYNTSEYVLLNGEIYYIAKVQGGTSGTLMRYSDGAVLADLSGMWMASATSFWRGNYSRLSTDGKYLYYNTAKAVYRFDVATNTAEKIFEPDLSAYENYSIYGFRYENGKLIYDIFSKANFTAETPIDLEYEYVANITGDVDGSGRVDSLDLVILAQMIASGNTNDSADINGDSAVSSIDLVTLAQLIASGE
ncbi:MAG: hypothetical protein IJO64_00490 [Clostridia bacterium]|nr:hypothetical protein [Clostridia bacterium]